MLFAVKSRLQGSAKAEVRRAKNIRGVCRCSFVPCVMFGYFVERQVEKLSDYHVLLDGEEESVGSPPPSGSTKKWPVFRDGVFLIVGVWMALAALRSEHDTLLATTV